MTEPQVVPDQSFHLFIRGNPVAQGRPIFARRGAYVSVRDPAKSMGWKQAVYYMAIEGGAQLIEGPLHLTLSFKMLRPKSLSWKIQHHVKKPDIDNLVKAVSDGLKGACFRDDSQVVRLVATKEYGEVPGVDIQIVKV